MDLKIENKMSWRNLRGLRVAIGDESAGDWQRACELLLAPRRADTDTVARRIRLGTCDYSVVTCIMSFLCAIRSNKEWDYKWWIFSYFAS